MVVGGVCGLEEEGGKRLNNQGWGGVGYFLGQA